MIFLIMSQVEVGPLLGRGSFGRVYKGADALFLQFATHIVTLSHEY